MGTAMFGDLMHADTPQTLLYFADHTLRAIGADLDETRRQLRLAGFDGIVPGLRGGIPAARQSSLGRISQSGPHHGGHWSRIFGRRASLSGRTK